MTLPESTKITQKSQKTCTGAIDRPASGVYNYWHQYIKKLRAKIDSQKVLSPLVYRALSHTKKEERKVLDYTEEIARVLSRSDLTPKKRPQKPWQNEAIALAPPADDLAAAAAALLEELSEQTAQDPPEADSAHKP